MQGRVTGQTAAVTTGCGVSTVAMGTPGPPIPGTPQLKTPPRPVRLVAMPRAPFSTQTVAVTTPSTPILQTQIINMNWIQDKTPQPVTTIKQEPSNVAMIASAQKVSVAVKKRG